MTRYSIFDSPLLLGFDQLEQMMDRVAKTANSGYPPYNIEQIGQNQLRITLAVAGFSMDNLQVTTEDRQLVIRGVHPENKSDSDRIFLHRGIAERQFQRSFMLSDELEIDGAHMDNGLLHIDLTRIMPEKHIQKIPIQSKQPQKKQPRQLAIESDLSTRKKEESDE